jgi:2-methylcitrate dehydratase PrpD
VKKSITQNLAEFIAKLRVQDIPTDVIAYANDLFIDWLANAAAGYRTQFGRALYAIGGRFQQRGRSHLIATLNPVDPITAAFINAGSSHATEFDDSHRTSLYHPGSPVIAAALALAEEEKSDGATFLTAIVAGYEISIRLAANINPSHYRLWHTTGTVGAFGAAAATCKIVGFKASDVAHALGLAGTQAGGLWEVLPDAPQAKNLHPAKAAQAGVLAALLAQQKIEGPPTILEGPRGFFKAMVPEPPAPEDLLKNLGKKWRLIETTMKAYPICGHAMTPVEAALLARQKTAPNQIERITVYTNSTAIRVAGNRHPLNEYQAKFSIPYCVTVAILYGRVTQSEFNETNRKDRKVQDLINRIEMKVDDTFERNFKNTRTTRMEVFTKEGRRITTQASNRKGDPEWPLSETEKQEKFYQLTEPVWGHTASEDFIRSKSRIIGFKNIGVLFDKTAGLLR